MSSRTSSIPLQLVRQYTSTSSSLSSYPSSATSASFVLTSRRVNRAGTGQGAWLLSSSRARSEDVGLGGLRSGSGGGIGGSRRWESSFGGAEKEKGKETRPPPTGAESGSFGSRLKNAFSTPTQWDYRIPLAAGALVLVAVQFRKQYSTSPRSGSGGDKVQVEDDGEGGHMVSGKGSGPWQVRVLGALPLRSLSQLWGYLNSLVLPIWFRPVGFHLYSVIFGCNLEEIDPVDLREYESLGEFFYRRLKDGARVIDSEAALVSPADGRVLHYGEISGAKVEQVKGMTYSLDALLGTSGQSVTKPEEIQFKQKDGKNVDDEHFAEINDIPYSLQSLLGSSSTSTKVHESHDPSSSSKSHKSSEPHDASIPSSSSLSHDASVAMTIGTNSINSQSLSSDAEGQSGGKGGVPKLKPGNKLFFLVVYLAPGDYHRFHSPTAWVVERRRHFTGDLFSVSPYIANRLKDLFVLNERVALLGRWKHGFFGMVPVGATNVGSIKINFDEALRTNERYSKHPPHTFTEAVYTGASSLLQGQPLTAGEEMGGFKLGSTIVLVFEAPENFKFNVEAGQKIKVGEGLGKLV